jgi:hypothetical protein
MIIDCDECTVRDIACDDCVVSFLLAGPPVRAIDDPAGQALQTLAEGGLVPPLRMRRAAG